MATNPDIPKNLREQDPARGRGDVDIPGDAPMTDEQAHRLKALCWQRGERYDDTLTSAEAERRIAELMARG